MNKIKSKSESIVQQAGLKNPGDNLSARITSSGRQVIKVNTDNGSNKYSAVKYPNGTTVETKVTKNQ